MAAPTQGKAGGERVSVLAGSLSVKTKGEGKVQQTIILRPTKRVADKLNLEKMSDEQFEKYRLSKTKDGKRAVEVNGRWRGGTTVIVPDPTGKDTPPFQLRKKGSKFLRFRVPSGMTVADIAGLLEKGGKAKYFSVGSSMFYPIAFAKTLKAKNLKAAKA